MKKFLIGLVVGAILFIPVGSMAWGRQQIAKPIYGVDCMRPTTDDDQGRYCGVSVYVFDDSGNKCYVSKDSDGKNSSISCVKN